MVSIRLMRMGKKKQPFYRIVAAHSRNARDGGCIERLGTYDPNQDPAAVTLQSEKINAWVARGAKLSPTVASLMAKDKGSVA